MAAPAAAAAAQAAASAAQAPAAGFPGTPPLFNGGPRNREPVLTFLCQPPALEAPPTRPRPPQEGRGQPTRFLDFVKEIKGKPVFGLVCHSLVSVCTTAVQANAAFCCRAGPCSKFGECAVQANAAFCCRAGPTCCNPLHKEKWLTPPPPP